MAKKQKKYFAEHGDLSPVNPQLKPFSCLRCGAALSINNQSNIIKCPACGNDNDLPEEYIALRNSKNLHSQALENAESLSRKISKPPGIIMQTWYNISLSVANIFGVIMAILIWVSGLSFLVLLLIIYMIFYFIAPSLHINLIDVYGSGLCYSLTFVAISVIFVLPLVLNSYVKDFIELRKILHASLIVNWPQNGAKQACCRNCGAPVEAAPDATYAQCIYCDTQNLISLPEKWLKKIQGFAKWHFKTIEDAVLTEKKYRRGLRKNILNWFLGTLIAGAFFWGIGNFIQWVDNDPLSVPSWNELTKSGKTMLAADFTSLKPDENLFPEIQKETLAFAPMYWIAMEFNEKFVITTSGLNNACDIYVYNTTNIESIKIYQNLEWQINSDSTKTIEFTAPYKGIFGINTLIYGKPENPFTIVFKLF